MSTVREVLHEVKERRLHEDRVFSLRTPWHAPFRSLLSQVPWLLTSVWLFRTTHPLTTWQIVLIATSVAFGVANVVLDVRARDRTWRDVIRREAPELYAKLNDQQSTRRN